MLETPRDAGQGMVLKGWAEVRVAPHDLAAREASEEAGLVGKVAPQAVGEVTHEKRFDDGRRVLCKVRVFPVWVNWQLVNWPEQHQRETRRFKLAEARMAGEEGGLVTLLLSLAAPEV
ncbi:NUDIX hydrolase [Teichococcus deserti]|uniref:NUDIX hydrolase n=1 Tax=Teichococcus deserti TaxID=1817963 RepID=UPI00105552B0|nr:NUDIX hydrolase [Pseudoroseomonas deserti]